MTHSNEPRADLTPIFLKNWIPRRLRSFAQEYHDREEIVRRCIDLSQNDPNAAGMVDSMAATIIGMFKGKHTEKKAADVVDIARQVTGIDALQKAFDAMVADPDKVLAFKEKLLDHALEIPRRTTPSWRSSTPRHRYRLPNF